MLCAYELWSGKVQVGTNVIRLIKLSVMCYVIHEKF